MVAEAGAVVPAEQQMGLACEGELLPHHQPYVHGGGPIGEEIEIGVIHRLRIGAEHGGIYRHVHLVQHFGQTAAALAADPTVESAPPQVLAFAGSLKLAVYHHGTHQVEPQSVEGRIVGLELALGPNGTALKVPDIHTQHSLLT